MYHHYNNTAQNSQEEDDNFLEIHEIKADRRKKSFIQSYQSNTSSANLSNTELRFLSTIGKYTYGSGVCFATTKTIAKDNPYLNGKEAAIRKIITSTRKKGFLFSYQLHNKNRNGSVRFMVREEECELAYETFINQKRFHMAEALKNFFKMDIKTEGSAPKSRSGHCAKKSHSILPTVIEEDKIVNKNNNKEESIDKRPPPFFDEMKDEIEKLDHKSRHIINQLMKSTHSEEKKNEGLKCFLNNREEFMNKDEPIEYVMKMAAWGWAKERNQRDERKQLAKKREEESKKLHEKITSNNQLIAQKAKEILDEENRNNSVDFKQQDRIYIDGNLVVLHTPSGCHRFDCADANFIPRLEKIYSKNHEWRVTL